MITLNVRNRIRCKIKWQANYLYYQIIIFLFTAAYYGKLTMEYPMDLDISLQDVIRCNICDIPVPSRHCDICDTHLCEKCEVKHISDESKEHVIVSFDLRRTTPKCSKHSKQICARYCKKCNTPICALCVSRGKHKKHTTVHISKMADDKEKPRKNDLKTTAYKLQTRNCIIILCFICYFFIGCFSVYCSTFVVDQYSKIDRWIIFFVLYFFLSLFQFDFVLFCLRLGCGLDMDIGILNLFCNYLIPLITRTKEYVKNELQINFDLPAISGHQLICFLIDYVIRDCSVWIPVIYLFIYNEV